VHTAVVSAKGWVVIPKDLRVRFGLKRGSRVQVIERDKILALVPVPDDPVEALHGMLARGPSLTADLLNEHQRDLHGEEPGHE